MNLIINYKDMAKINNSLRELKGVGNGSDALNDALYYATLTRDRSAFDVVEYATQDGEVIFRDIFGEPLGTKGAYYYIKGLRYLVLTWVYYIDECKIIFICKLS